MLKQIFKLSIVAFFVIAICVLGSWVGALLTNIINVEVSDFVIIGVGFLASMISVLSIIVAMENKAKDYAEQKLVEFNEKMWRLLVYYDEYFFWSNQAIERKKEYNREVSLLKEKIEMERHQFMVEIQRLRLGNQAFLVGEKSYQYGERRKEKEKRIEYLMTVQKKTVDESILETLRASHIAMSWQILWFIQGVGFKVWVMCIRKLY